MSTKSVTWNPNISLRNVLETLRCQPVMQLKKFFFMKTTAESELSTWHVACRPTGLSQGFLVDGLRHLQFGSANTAHGAVLSCCLALSQVADSPQQIEYCHMNK